MPGVADFPQIEITRRNFFVVCSSVGLGIAFARMGMAAPPRQGDIDPLIIVHLSGGAPAKETFNPDPRTTRSGNPIEERTRGPFASIATRVTGVHFSEVFEKLALRNDRFALIRSLDSGSSDHTPSQQTSVLSGRTTVNERVGEHASRGAVPYALLNPGSTWYGLRDAFRSNDAFAPIWNSGRGIFEPPRPSGSLERFNEQVDLLHAFEKTSPRIHSSGADRYEQFREGAIDLRRGGGRFFGAFDLPKDEREQYGASHSGDRILLARRMVQRGAGSVTVYDEPEAVAWDTHNTTKKRIETLGGPMDKAIAALLDDMHNGIVRCVLLLTTEFNRGPDMSDGGGTGRPHWQYGNWAILAGSRVRGGVTVGETDHRGRITRNPILQRDNLPNTVMKLCGMDLPRTDRHVTEVIR